MILRRKEVIMQAKAIRTRYGGTHFRSRLEARWSIVLTALGLPWMFEPIMFRLPSGNYLPDFEIFSGTAHAFWIEVKGGMPDAREFTVGTEVNVYVAPLVIFSGSIPSKITGGSAWFYDPVDHEWSLISPEKALLRLLWREAGERPDTLGEPYHQAIGEARRKKFEEESEERSWHR